MQWSESLVGGRQYSPVLEVSGMRKNNYGSCTSKKIYHCRAVHLLIVFTGFAILSICLVLEVERGGITCEGQLSLEEIQADAVACPAV